MDRPDQRSEDQLDQHLRGALRTLAPIPSFDLDALDRMEADVRSDAARAQRRHHRRIGLTAGALTAAAAVLVAALVWPSNGNERVTTSPATTPSPSQPPPEDGRLIALTTTGSIAELSTSTGQSTRVLATSDSSGIGAVSADGSAAYTVEPLGPPGNQTMNSYGIFRRTLPGGSSSLVIGIGPSADALAVSPDGQTLAAGLGPRVSIIGVASGRATTIELPPVTWSTQPAAGPTGDAVSTVTALSWASDDRRLAVSFETVSGYRGVELLDTERATGTGNPRLLGPVSPTGSLVQGWSSATFEGQTGRLAVWVSCRQDPCHLPPTIESIDTTSGRRLATEWTAGLHLADVDQVTIASDASGRSLYVARDTLACSSCQGGSGWELDRVDPSGALRLAGGGRPDPAEPRNLAWVP